jgi:hypothetical protein
MAANGSTGRDDEDGVEVEDMVDTAVAAAAAATLSGGGRADTADRTAAEPPIASASSKNST